MVLLASLVQAQQAPSGTVAPAKPAEAAATVQPSPSAVSAAPGPLPNPPAPKPEPKPPADLQQLRPNALPYRIERKVFGANASFKRVEIYWIPPAVKPKAYLVLLLNMAKPRLPLEDRQWVEFAQKQGLGLISVGLDELETVTRFSEAADDLGNRIYQIATTAFGPNLKGTTFASGLGGVWMHRVMMRRPWLWGFWCTRDVARYPLASRSMEYPAGLVLSTNPADYDENLFFFQDLRRIKATNRVGFASIDGRTVDAAYLDRFGCNYLAAVLAGVDSARDWMDVNTKVNCATLEKPPSPVVQSWVPGDETAGAWMLLHQEQKRLPDCVIAFADVKAPDKGSPIKLVFRVPGKVRAGAPVRMVMLAVLWADNDAEFEKKFRGSLDFKAALWDRNRIGVIGINAKAYGFPVDVPNALTPQELAKLLERVQAHSPELWSVIGKATGELGWPNGPFYLMGAGTGAEIAHCLAQAEPARFAAVQLQAGAVYMAPKSELANLPCLITTGGKHAGYEATVKFYQAAKKAGWPVLINAFGGASGGMEDWVWGTGVQFFSYLRDLSDVAKKEATEGKRPATDTAAAVFIEKLAKSPVFADLATRKFVLAKDLEQIPAANRVSVPCIQVEEALRINGPPKPAVPIAAGNTVPVPGGAPPAIAPDKPVVPPNQKVGASVAPATKKP